MRKIGILTFHRSINPGAVLQAMGTVKALGELYPGARVEVVDYIPRQGLFKEIKLNVRGSRVGKIARGIRLTYKYWNFVNRSLPLSHDRLITDDFGRAAAFIRSQGYDLLVTGSDTVFEIKRKRGYTCPPPNPFWLPAELGPARRVAFAASADKSEFDSLTVGDRAWLGKALSKFDHLAVRDELTQRFMVDLGVSPEHVQVVPDPTFVLDAMPTKVADKLRALGIDTGRPILGVNLAKHEAAFHLRQRFKPQGYQIVSLTNSPAADFNLAGHLDPLEWADMYRHLTLTVTDRFHGTIFALQAGCPVLSVDDSPHYKSQDSKKRSLLADCALLDLHVAPPDLEAGFHGLDEKLDRILQQHDRERVARAVQAQRARVQGFLSRLTAS